MCVIQSKRPRLCWLVTAAHTHTHSQPAAHGAKHAPCTAPLPVHAHRELHRQHHKHPRHTDPHTQHNAAAAGPSSHGIGIRAAPTAAASNKKAPNRPLPPCSVPVVPCFEFVARQARSQGAYGISEHHTAHLHTTPASYPHRGIPAGLTSPGLEARPQPSLTSTLGPPATPLHSWPAATTGPM